MQKFFATTESATIRHEQELAMDAFIGYMKTQSAYQALLRAGQADPMPALEADLTSLLGPKVRVNFPLHLFLAENPLAT